MLQKWGYNVGAKHLSFTFLSIGRSDDLPEHYGDGGKEHEASTVGKKLVVSRGDAPEPLQLVEEALDEIALFVERLVIGKRRPAIGFWTGSPARPRV